MKIIALSLLTAIFALACEAETRPASTWYSVDVHLNTKMAIETTLVLDGEKIATMIFSKIHVRLSWRANHRKQGNSRAVACAYNSSICDIAVEIVAKAPPTVNGAALAVAMPYAGSGVRILIFFDRVTPLLYGHRAAQANILGYVLAHEIAHVLQGTPRHAKTGIMQARWSGNDFRQMRAGVLTFSPEDVELIRRRLDASVPENLDPQSD